MSIEEEEEEEKPKQMQGLRGYLSSGSRGESTVGVSLLSLYVTNQEKRLWLTATVTRPVFQLAFYHYKPNFKR